jgi:hypothetical protein
MRVMTKRLKHRLAADERGFSMVLVIMVMIATGMFVAAGFAAANGDLPIARDSQDRKAAYAAAESGVNFYQFHLNADNNYWLKCDNVPKPNVSENNPVNQRWDGVAPDTRRWRNVSGSDAQYMIELIPAKGTKCIEGDQNSMVDPKTGTFRIRVTGRPNATSSLHRTINATFRRKSFLDFLYFTDFETLDPEAYASVESVEWARDNCAKRYRATRPSGCTPIRFASIDFLNGPLHTNDDLLTCGNPTFGRTTHADKLEVSSPVKPGWKADGSSCDDTQPVFNGGLVYGADVMKMPPTNTSLKAVAQTGGLVFTGKTTIRFLDTGGMSVSNPKGGFTDKYYGLPSNGVIYVQDGPNCGNKVAPIQANYGESDDCAKVYVSGQYTGDVTLASADDIIVKSPDGTSDPMLKPAGDADHVLGLIANNYVRVYHKVKTVKGVCSNDQAMETVTIHAAILSLEHSFIVDNWGCGAKLDKLKVFGAIAQMYRGPVGTGGADPGGTGYPKDYNYDDRLRFRSPPYFLDPIAANWRVLRTNEQVPAAK